MNDKSLPSRDLIDYADHPPPRRGVARRGAGRLLVPSSFDTHHSNWPRRARLSTTITLRVRRKAVEAGCMIAVSEDRAKSAHGTGSSATC